MEEKELREIIEKAARDGRKELNLSSEKIKSLPAEIGRLTNLQGFWLGGNQLTSVPKELGQLTNLTELYLHENQLVSLGVGSIFSIGGLKRHPTIFLYWCAVHTLRFRIPLRFITSIGILSGKAREKVHR